MPVQESSRVESISTPLALLRRMTRALRHVPGGVMLGEAIRKPMARHARRIRVDDFDGNMVMTLDLSEHMQSQSFWHGYYSRDIVCLLKRILRPGMYAIDGGANVGEISLVSAKCVESHGLVVAFEPVEHFANQLEENVRANGLDWVEIRRTGLSDTSGSATMYLSAESFDDGTHHDGLGTLFPSVDRGHAVGAIPLSTLDELRSERERRVDFIKLDIEGAELAALQGGERLLATQAPMLIVEIADETCRSAGYAMQDILTFLSRFGYRFHRIERKGHLAPVSAGELGAFQNVFCTTGDLPA